MITLCTDDGKQLVDSCMEMMVHIMSGKTVSAKFESITFEIRLRPTINDIMWSPQYLVQLNDALLDTDEFLEPVGRVSKTEIDRAIEENSKGEKQSKTIAQAS